jgi:hypothetical protein
VLLSTVESLPGVASAVPLGEVVRVLVAEGGPSADDLRRAVEACGLKVRRSDRVRMDMEAAFAYLFGEARSTQSGAIGGAAGGAIGREGRGRP